MRRQVLSGVRSGMLRMAGWHDPDLQTSTTNPKPVHLTWVPKLYKIAIVNFLAGSIGHVMNTEKQFPTDGYLSGNPQRPRNSLKISCVLPFAEVCWGKCTSTPATRGRFPLKATAEK